MMTRVKRNKKPEWLRLLIDGFRIVLLSMLLAVVSNLILQLFQNQFDWSQPFNYMFFWETQLFFLGSIVLMIIYLWITALIGNRWISSGVFLIGILLMAVTTQQKMFVREEPLYPSDLAMVTDLPFILQMVDWKLLVVFLGLLSVLIGFSIYYMFKKDRKKQNKYEKVY